MSQLIYSNWIVWFMYAYSQIFYIACLQSSGDPVTQCEFHPYIDNQIVCCGKSQITFWTYDGNSLNKKAGIFEVGIAGFVA